MRSVMIAMVLAACGSPAPIAAALEPRATLRAAIDAIPTGSPPAWFAEQRIDVQPAMTDTPRASAWILP